MHHWRCHSHRVFLRSKVSLSKVGVKWGVLFYRGRLGGVLQETKARGSSIWFGFDGEATFKETADFKPPRSAELQAPGKSVRQHASSCASFLTSLFSLFSFLGFCAVFTFFIFLLPLPPPPPARPIAPAAPPPLLPPIFLLLLVTASRLGGMLQILGGSISKPSWGSSKCRL